MSAERKEPEVERGREEGKLSFSSVVGNLQEILRGRYKLSATFRPNPYASVGFLLMNAMHGGISVTVRYHTERGLRKKEKALRESPRLREITAMTRVDLLKGEIPLDGGVSSDTE